MGRVRWLANLAHFLWHDSHATEIAGYVQPAVSACRVWQLMDSSTTKRAGPHAHPAYKLQCRAGGLRSEHWRLGSSKCQGRRSCGRERWALTGEAPRV